jgi:hypothetical protein
MFVAVRVGSSSTAQGVTLPENASSEVAKALDTEYIIEPHESVQPLLPTRQDSKDHQHAGWPLRRAFRLVSIATQTLLLHLHVTSPASAAVLVDRLHCHFLCPPTVSMGVQKTALQLSLARYRQQCCNASTQSFGRLVASLPGDLSDAC